MNEIHPNLKQLSNSSLVTLHKCPRKYELEKLSTRKPDGWGDDDWHLDFGKLVGIGLQEYLITDSLEKAHWAMFRFWKGGMLDDDRGELDKKTFWFGLYAINKFVGVRKSLFGNYRLAYFDDKPAVELGFSIDCGDGFFYRGFIDAVVIDSLRGELIAIECKTTKSRDVHEAVYKHSGQALGYSIILDSVAKMLGKDMGSSYKVIYPVYKTGGYEWDIQRFTKRHTERALWIRNILLDKSYIMERGEDSYFPMHGESCFDFFRACPFFGTCELSNASLVGKVEERVESPEKYQFHFTLEEIIEAQLAKHEAEEEA